MRKIKPLSPFGMSVIAQEIDQQPHAEAGAAFRPIRLDGLEKSRPGNVEMEPRIIDEVFDRDAGRQDAAPNRD